MKTCVNWRKSFRYLDQVDEYNIEYKPDKIDKLLKFLDKYGQEKRVNIEVSNFSEIEVLIALNEKYDYNIATKIVHLKLEDDQLEKLRCSNLPYFFSVAAKTWLELRKLLNYGVSDVFITGELGFDLKRVADVVGPNVQIRAYVNISQEYVGDGLTGFFIRPEDIDYYAEYINVFEFYQEEEKLSILYEIYFKDKKWDGRLQEIVKSLGNTVNNYYLLGDEFARRRITCERKCYKGNNCHLCNILVDLANVLEKSPDYEVFERR